MAILSPLGKIIKTTQKDKVLLNMFVFFALVRLNIKYSHLSNKTICFINTKRIPQGMNSVFLYTSWVKWFLQISDFQIKFIRDLKGQGPDLSRTNEPCFKRIPSLNAQSGKTYSFSRNNNTNTNTHTLNIVTHRLRIWDFHFSPD